MIPPCRRLNFKSPGQPIAAVAFLLCTLLARCPAHAIEPRDEAFDIRLDFTAGEKGDAAAFAFVEKEFARDARPHIKAWYGEYLLGGKAWGAPEGQEQRGIELVQEAFAAGSVEARRVLGWQLMTGRHLPVDPQRGMLYLREALAQGSTHALVTLADVFRQGVGTAVDWTEAETWSRRAAWIGKPYILERLAAAYESVAGATAVQKAKACELHYAAAIHGSGPAEKRLKQLFEQKDAAGTRAYELLLLWRAHLGWRFQTAEVRRTVQHLETSYPDDLAVMLSIGEMYASGRLGFRDFKKAYALFEKAAQRGSDDAQAQLARLLVEGYGVKKDQARGLQIWRELEVRGNAQALGFLGFHHYWGTLAGAGLAKDPILAYDYCRRAADLGDYFGQLNAGACYEHGIGVKMDYLRAAAYYRAAAWRGAPDAEEKMRRLLAFVK